MFSSLKGKYRCIVIDPPWPYPGGFATQSRTAGKWEGKVKTTALPYPSMTLEEIKDMDIQQLAKKDCRLWLWTTNRYLPYAFELLSSWGFKYSQTIVWHKADGNLGGGIFPNSAEYIVVGTRGVPGRKGKGPSSVIKASQSKTHSKKPEIFQDLIEQLTYGPYLELFARRPRPGWTVWGNESGS